MSPSQPDQAPGPRDLDIDHLADLANLPLEPDEAADLAQACQEVLEAFGLPDVQAEPETPEPQATFEDTVEACPPDQVDEIVDLFPRRDGRWLTP